MLTLGLAHSVTRFLADRAGMTLRRADRAIFLATAGATGFFQYRDRMPTPSHNLFAFHGTPLCAIALLRAELPQPVKAAARYRSIASHALLLGVGGAIAFLAKATTGAALAVVSLVWLLSSQRHRGIAIAVTAPAIGATLVLAYVEPFKGGMLAWLARIGTGIDLERALGARHTLGDATIEAVRDT